MTPSSPGAYVGLLRRCHLVVVLRAPGVVVLRAQAVIHRLSLFGQLNDRRLELHPARFTQIPVMPRLVPHGRSLTDRTPLVYLLSELRADRMR